MKVYLNNNRVQSGTHNIHVAPASHLPATACPKEWFDKDGTTPKQITVTFESGAVEASDALAKYLVEYGFAKKSRLILPRHDLVA